MVLSAPPSPDQMCAINPELDPAYTREMINRMRVLRNGQLKTSNNVAERLKEKFK